MLGDIHLLYQLSKAKAANAHEGLKPCLALKTEAQTREADPVATDRFRCLKSETLFRFAPGENRGQAGPCSLTLPFSASGPGCLRCWALLRNEQTFGPWDLTKWGRVTVKPRVEIAQRTAGPGPFGDVHFRL